MKLQCTYLPYRKTNAFTPLVLDYLQNDEKLRSFYEHEVSVQGFEEAILQRQGYPANRSVLVTHLRQQYSSIVAAEAVHNNIALLAKDTSFTVTTAHQPNIFTGPLYFIYKIAHAISLAVELKSQFPQYNFVPVYYMGSEDADLDELGSTYVQGHLYKWQTKQTGAVGRMKVDKSFLSLISALEAQVAVLPNGGEFIQLLREAYTENESIARATLKLVNSLFGTYGLVVLDGDGEALKRLFIPVIRKELEQQFSHSLVASTAEKLSKHYKVQAGGRDINLFYLEDGSRERVVYENGVYTVAKGDKRWSSFSDIMQEVEEHPQRFSPNVILRAVFQEQVLPNVAFIGGGAEVAYWMELKSLFETVEVPYPVIVLRNSFMVAPRTVLRQFETMGFKQEQLFEDTVALLNDFVKTKHGSTILLKEEMDKLSAIYEMITNKAAAFDVTLSTHVKSLEKKALHKLQELEKKMLRAEKRKHQTDEARIQKLKHQLFPGGSLQERKENVAWYYGMFGKDFIDEVVKHSLPFQQQFGVLAYD